MAARLLIVEEAPNPIVPSQYPLIRGGYDLMATDGGFQARGGLPAFRPDALIALHRSVPHRPATTILVDRAPQAGRPPVPGEA
jgi:predicted RNA-binding Zn ribbon-like protein